MAIFARYQMAEEKQRNSSIPLKLVKVFAEFQRKEILVGKKKFDNSQTILLNGPY